MSGRAWIHHAALNLGVALEALAYAESGALDQWQQALTSASAARIARNRRRNQDRKRVTRMKRKAARASEV